MPDIYITGFNGFVGSYVVKQYENRFYFNLHSRNDKINIQSEDVVLHLAGKAHDIASTSSQNEYYSVNTDFTKDVFEAFLSSDAKVFITLSSVKAVADVVEGDLNEDHLPSPLTHYGKSKLLAEQYISSKIIPDGKRVYVLRPCMIHGPGNKGNLNLLYKFVSKGIFWPFGAFENKRSFCSIDNLMFIFNELFEREDIPSGIYNVADDEPISINELIVLMAKSRNREQKFWNISKRFIERIAFFGDKIYLPLNSERLQKLSSSYVVSNAKIKIAIGKPLPLSSKEGLLKTFKSFNC